MSRNLTIGAKDVSAYDDMLAHAPGGVQTAAPKADAVMAATIWPVSRKSGGLRVAPHEIEKSKMSRP